MVKVIGRVRGGLKGASVIRVDGDEISVQDDFNVKRAKFHKTFNQASSNREVFTYVMDELEECLFKDR